MAGKKLTGGAEWVWTHCCHSLCEGLTLPVGQPLFPVSPSDDLPSLLGGDHRYMNNYTSSYGNEWSTPDTMKRYSMYLTPKGEGVCYQW